MQKIHHVLLGVSILPALLVMPAAADLRLVINEDRSFEDGFSLTGVSYGGDQYGGAMSVNNFSTVLFNGSASFTDNSSTYASGLGGALYVNNNNGGSSPVLNKVYFTGATEFTGNTANSGGGLYSEGKVVFLDTATFTNNNNTDGANSTGGGIVGHAGLSDITFKKAATFTNNGTAGNTYGGAGVNNLGVMVFEDTATFTGNVAKGSGSAFANGGTMTFQKGLTVTGNRDTVELDGVGIANNGAISNGGTLSVYGGDIDISGNRAAGKAGLQNNDTLLFGAYKDGEDIVVAPVDNITFSNNNATAGNAAAIHVHEASTTTQLYANNILFENNDSTGHNKDAYSGAIWTDDELKIQGATITFKNNDANGTTDVAADLFKYGGGAIQHRGYNQGASNLTIGLDDGSSQISFEHNTSKTNGGALHVRVKGAAESATTAIQGQTEFKNNHADLNGGAIYHYVGAGTSTLSLTDGTVFTGNSSGEYGGAIYNTGTMTVGGDFDNNWAYKKGGAIYNAGSLTVSEGSSFTGNTTTWDGAAGSGPADVNSNGGAIWNSGTLTIGNDVNFLNNHASNSTTSGSGHGSDIYNYGGTVEVGDNLSISRDENFNPNPYTHDCAIFTVGGSLTIGSNANFTNISEAIVMSSNATLNIGDGLRLTNINNGIDNWGTGNVIIGENATFDGTRFRFLTNEDSKNTTMTIGDNAIFTNAMSSTFGSIYNGTGETMEFLGSSEFTNNKAYANNAGVFQNFKGTLLFDGDATFTGNMAGGVAGALRNRQATSVATFDGSAIFTGNAATGDAGAIINEGTLTFNGEAAFAGNIAGALVDYIADENGIFVDSETGLHYTWTLGDVDNSTAKNGGAINNTNILTFNDSATFTGNTASGLGGAIYNTGTLTFNDEATFSENFANGVANDIYNTGTVTLNAASGKTIALNGGIDGVTNGTTTGKLNITGAGLVEVSTIKNQTVALDNGMLHLVNGLADGSNLTGSTLTVASGATINTIDSLINNYTGKIALNTGAIIAGDIDYQNGLADTYSAATGATAVTYKLANALNVSNGETKEIQVVDGAVTVNADDNFAWFNSDAGMTLVTSGSADGKVKVSGQTGGINAAVDYTNEYNQEVAYNLTATETFDGVDNTIENAEFTITGNGNAADSNQLILAANLNVDGSSTLTLNNVALAQSAGTETIHNAEGGNLVITDSRISVNINNAGTLNSDPTYYDAQVVNSGTANFDGDIFESTSSLTNNGGEVNLAAVEFKAGSTVGGDGTGVINIQNGQTTFNGVVANNDLTMTNGATVIVGETGSIDGLALATAGGNVNLANGKVDNLGTVTASGNVNMSMDANLATGAIDNVTSLTGSGALVVNNINLTSSAYADSGVSVAMTVANGGGNVTLADDFTVTGGNNYFTNVTATDGVVVFGDKLMNTSGMHSQLGDWEAGNYISASSTYDTTTDAYTAQGQTVGQALTALDTALGHASSAGVAATGLVAGVEANTTAINTLNSTVDDHTSAISSLNSAVSSNTAAIDTLNGDADVVGSVDNKIALNLTNANNFAMQRDALTLGAANAYTDRQVEKLDKNLSAGVAGAVALSSVAVSNVRRGEVSVGAGYGYFNGQSAGAFGAAMGLSNRWSVNAGAGVSGYDVSFRAGTNYRFKLF